MNTIVNRIIRVIAIIVLLSVVAASAGCGNREDNSDIETNPVVIESSCETTAPQETVSCETEIPEESSATPVETEPVQTDATEPPTEETAETEGTEPVYETVYAIGDVNVRSGPSSKYGILGVLRKGEAVQRISKEDNGWSKVVYNGADAYVSSKYLSAQQSGSVDTASNTPSGSGNTGSGVTNSSGQNNSTSTNVNNNNSTGSNTGSNESSNSGTTENSGSSGSDNSSGSESTGNQNSGSGVASGGASSGQEYCCAICGGNHPVSWCTEEPPEMQPFCGQCGQYGHTNAECTVEQTNTCPRCGNEKGAENGHYMWVNDTTCPICGVLVPGMTCHIH